MRISNHVEEFSLNVPPLQVVTPVNHGGDDFQLQSCLWMRIWNHVEEFFKCSCAAGGHSHRVGEKSRGPTHCDGENWKVRVEEENKNENGVVFKHHRFSNTRSPRGAETRAVWIDGGIHARWGFYGFLAAWLLFWCPLSSPREWIAPATATYLLGKLVETFANNDTSTCGARAIQVVMVMLTS